MHVLINLSWRCQLSCEYCLLPHIKINRDAQEHSWEEWANALISNLPSGSVADIAGGDPLLFPGLVQLLDMLGNANIFWAITTNALHTKAVKELVAVHPKKCALVNVSDHPGNAKADKNIDLLRAHFPLKINRVDVPNAGKRKGINDLIPYQSWREGTELDGILRLCNSGKDHWVVDPGGDVFRCNPDMARGFPPIGNLFKAKIEVPEPIICESGCSSCYTSVPSAWPVIMVKI